MDSPLLSSIDVRHLNFLPPYLTVGKAWDLGTWLVRAESLVPVMDASADFVFQGRAVHRLVEEPQAQVQPTDQVTAELVNSSEVEQGEDEMVVRRTMKANWFLPSARPAQQQQQT